MDQAEGHAKSSATGSALGTILFVLVASIPNVEINLLGTGLLLMGALVIVRFFLADSFDRKILSPKDYAPTQPLFRLGTLTAILNSAIYGFILVALFSFGLIPALIGATTGILGALTVILLSSKASPITLDSKTVRYVTNPVIVAGLLLMPLLGEIGQIACCSIINAAHAFYRTSSISIISVANAKYNFHLVKQSAISRSPTLLGLLIGAGLGAFVFLVNQFSGQSFQLVMVVFVIIITVAVSLSELATSKNSVIVGANVVVEEQPPAEGKSETLDSHERALTEIFEKYHLSPRESEVFVLLAKGRNAEYIQNSLTLASGTVKTHIYHIYQKTGVNTQQQIIDIVDEHRAGTAPAE